MAKYSDYAKAQVNPHVSTPLTPEQVKNSAGGYVWQASGAQQLDRFLILGTEGGSYYANERKLTMANANTIKAFIQSGNGQYVVDRTTAISEEGRAPKNDPALFVLAMVAKYGTIEDRRKAFDALPRIARIGTHLFQFAEYLKGMEVGWGRLCRRAIAAWYTEKETDKLAYQLVKYRQRDGWSHRDMLRLSHPTPEGDVQANAFRWVTQGLDKVENREVLPAIIMAFEQAQKATTAQEIVGLIETHNLPREAIPTQFLNDTHVWEALLHAGRGMPMTAMIRNLGKMTSLGILAPMNDNSKFVGDRLRDKEVVRKARVHPLSVLGAMMTYQSGKGFKGSLTWKFVPTICDALETAFYNAFDNVEPTGQNWLLGIDVSGSMTWGNIAGMPNITPNIASATMAMVTARSEASYHIMGFADTFRDLGITATDSLESAIAKTRSMSFGSTDCSLPMRYAQENRIPVDNFVIYTDSETWQGQHAAQELRNYRKAMDVPAKLIVVAMLANQFTVADVNDPGMIDMVGFSTSTPQAMAEFARMSLEV